MNFIIEEPVETVVFLTGDQHFFSAHHHQTGLKEFQFGPLARGVPEETPGRFEQVFRRFEYNYGEVRVRGGANPRVEVRGRDAAGDEFYAEIVRPGVGQVSIDSDVPREFTLSGAHGFTGTAPATFSYAPTGRYRLRWSGDDEDAAVTELGAGESVTMP